MGHYFRRKVGLWKTKRERKILLTTDAGSMFLDSRLNFVSVADMFKHLGKFVCSTNKIGTFVVRIHECDSNLNWGVPVLFSRQVYKHT
jgi:hypothetical protein